MQDISVDASFICGFLRSVGMLWNNLRWWDKYKREVKLVGLCPGIASVGPAGRRIAVARTGLVGRWGGQGAFEALDPRGSRVLLSPRADRSPPAPSPLVPFPSSPANPWVVLSLRAEGGIACRGPHAAAPQSNHIPPILRPSPTSPRGQRQSGLMEQWGGGGHLLTCHSIRVLWAAAMSSTKVPSDQQCRFSAAWGVCPSDVHRPPSAPSPLPLPARLCHRRGNGRI